MTTTVNTSTMTSNAVGITLTQKPDLAECRVYWLEVEDPIKREELRNFPHKSYEEDEAVVQQAINEGYATVISVQDLVVL
jgi:hypothetical protein